MSNAQDLGSWLPEPPEQLEIDFQAPGLRAAIAGRARLLLSRPATAATAVFMVIVAIALLLTVAPVQGMLIVAARLMLSIGLMVLTRFGKRKPDPS